LEVVLTPGAQVHDMASLFTDSHSMDHFWNV
jgi:hypothetical protein